MAEPERTCAWCERLLGPSRVEVVREDGTTRFEHNDCNALGKACDHVDYEAPEAVQVAPESLADPQVA